MMMAWAQCRGVRGCHAARTSQFTLVKCGAWRTCEVVTQQYSKEEGGGRKVFIMSLNPPPPVSVFVQTSMVWRCLCAGGGQSKGMNRNQT